ncbi:aminopeptidase P family protein [Aquibium sp. A9E412]|uniref:aminopeptidase P family protein n=1 Tax=Aquibium sp. A9E412 TaxID=2976767 RepID=UPI0025B0488E|nr:aminopeptidase P family protein [Aquibium sp. A9E412]MDN2567539.1 aminopeptidase P family protein [Aquibium sp. A9E412]
MFQSFDTPSEPAQAAPRIARLRAWLAAEGLDGFLVPRADEHQGEYVPARAERLRWLTGFSGSAGVALVLADGAHLFVDGRYTLQARQQTDPAVFSVESLIDKPPRVWLAENAAPGARIGFDPWLHTVAEAGRLRAALDRAQGTLVALDTNPVDLIWDDQPAPPAATARVHPPRHAGQPADEKLAAMQALLQRETLACTVLTDPASLAWTFNLRGADVPHTPLLLGFALIRAEGRHALYLEPRALGAEVEAHLAPLAEVRPRAELEDALAALAAGGGRVGLDPDLAAERLRLVVEATGGTVVPLPDPARLPRATKNAAELAGARDAHRRDGVALARFLCWLDAQPPGTTDEIAAVTRLEALRAEVGKAAQMPLRDVAFDTISGSGPHGAIIHYRVSETTNRTLAAGELFLVDSGAQYEDGTTDVTRTVPVGAPTGEMRRHYTIVLKGLIGLSQMRFPPGTRGMDLDPIARQNHWRAGLDYGHGTGHGVGAYLSVHEGPQRIARTGSEPLLPGMILSNEPGYYREGHYGIRLENLIVVRPEEPVPGGDLPMHAFETLTLAPFDRRLIDVDLLAPGERAWLDAYHARVLAEIGPQLDDAVRAWLEAACAPL